MRQQGRRCSCVSPVPILWLEIVLQRVVGLNRLLGNLVDDFLLAKDVHIASLALLSFMHELVPVLLTQVILVAVHAIKILLLLLLFLPHTALMLDLLSLMLNLLPLILSLLLS